MKHAGYMYNGNQLAGFNKRQLYVKIYTKITTEAIVKWTNEYVSNQTKNARVNFWYHVYETLDGLTKIMNLCLKSQWVIFECDPVLQTIAKIIK